MLAIDTPSNNDPGPVGQSHDGLRQLKPSTTADEIVRRGQEALLRLCRSYDDWMDIAEALQVGRAEVMAATHTNRPTGKRYAKAMGEWLLARSFHLINEGTRNRLLDCLKDRVEIEKWRTTLTEGKRFSFNHPDAVLRKWKAATVVPNPNSPPRTSAIAKLKEVNVELQEKLHRAEKELACGGGDLWTPEDTPEEIAKIMLGKLTTSKAERVARAILKKLTNKKGALSKSASTAQKVPALRGFSKGSFPTDP
jgi:hypothetical protein